MISMALSIWVTISSASLFGKYRRDGVTTGRGIATIRASLLNMTHDPAPEPDSLTPFRFLDYDPPRNLNREKVIVPGNEALDEYLLPGWSWFWAIMTSRGPFHTAGSIWMWTMLFFLLAAISVIVLAANGRYL